MVQIENRTFLAPNIRRPAPSGTVLTEPATGITKAAARKSRWTRSHGDLVWWLYDRTFGIRDEEGLYDSVQPRFDSTDDYKRLIL
jgi:hypothetical protein